MKKILLAAALAAGMLSARAELWRGLDEANWVAGARVTEMHLLGKVVLVYAWNPNDAEAKDMLARLEKVWKSYRSKPFVVLGSVSAASDAAKTLAANVTFPNYVGAGLAKLAPGAGGIYVVSHRGKVVYQGSGNNDCEREAETALGTAIPAVVLPPCLTGNLVFSKQHPYFKSAKAAENKLALGKKIDGFYKKLEKDIKKADAKNATPKDKEKAAAAAELIAAIDEAKADLQKEIDELKDVYPVGVAKLMEQFMKSFPKEGAAYKTELPEIKKRAAEQKKQMKEAAAAAKAAAAAAKK